MLGASLKKGFYRSPASYLSIYKGEAERRGYEWGSVLQRVVRDAVRSCLRGIGPPLQAQPLPLLCLGTLPGGRAPWTDRGPANPRNAIVVGSWFLLREVELANARAALVSVKGDAARPGPSSPSTFRPLRRISSPSARGALTGAAARGWRSRTALSTPPWTSSYG